MRERLFRGLVERRWLVLILAAGLVAAGVLNLRGFAVDAVPDISPKQVMVLTQAQGLGPLEVERLVTFPVENAMAGLPGMKGIRSTTRFGLSAVYVTFEDSADANTIRAMVFERLQRARETMPPGVGAPQMGPIATGLGEVYQFEVRGPGHTPMELRQVLQWTIAPKLRLVPGITDVNIYGGQLRTYEVRIRLEELRQYGLTLPQVFQALTDNNATKGGAYIEHGDEQQVVRGMALASSPADLQAIVLATAPDGTPITVGTVGEVVEAPKVRLGAVTHDGEGETVVGVALMQYGDNASQVIAAVKAAVGDISKQLPPGIEIRPYYDRSDLVGRTVSTVEHNLLEGAVLVIAVLLLVLGNLRAGLIVAVAIPLSMLVAFAGMRAIGLSGNLMSLGAIDFGLVVDGSVVLIENVMRRRAERADDANPREAVWQAAAEVARPVTFAVLIISLVYVPVLSLSGVEGKMFRPMALTVMMALGGSLLVTMLVMPALASVFLSDKTSSRDTWLVRMARRGYTPLLRRGEAHPFLTAAIAAGLFAAAAFFGMGLGGEFLPQLAEGSIVITSEKLPGINLDASLRTVTEIEKVVRSFPEAARVVSLTGSAEIPTDPMGVESTDSFITLTPQDQWKTADTQDGLVSAFEKKLKQEIPGVAFTFSQPIQMRMEDLLQGVRGDVALTIYGDDLGKLRELADQAVHAINGVKGAADVKAEAQGGLPALTVKVDRTKVARFGLNAADVLAVVEAIGGHTAGTIYGEEGQQSDVVVRLPADERGSVQRLSDLPVGGAGHSVKLSEVAEIGVADGPAQISRERLQRRIAVQINVRGRDIKSFVTEAQKAVGDKLHLPPRYSVEWSGQFQNLQDATARLSIVVPVMLASVFLLLYLNFGSVRLALLIFLNVPMAATGGIAALLLRGLPFSISAAIGFIATFGIAILNGVVLTSYIETERRAGKEPRQAAADAAETRLRPVLTTALVASLGFLPMAVSTTAGAEVQRPLATVVIGGLMTATLLTLVLLPALYPVFTEARLPSLARVKEWLRLNPQQRPAE